MLLINLARLLMCFSAAMDYTRQGLNYHHLRVASICRHFAEELSLPAEERRRLIWAALVHDCGVSTWKEKASLLEFETAMTWDHSHRGAELLQISSLLRELSPVIASHHDRFGQDNPSGLTGESIPLAARIIHLADRIDVLAGSENIDPAARKKIGAEIMAAGRRLFDPYLLEVFKALREKESFWLDLQPQFLLAVMKEECSTISCCSLNELLEIGEIFARVIDAKSRFTHRHSRGVALVAREMGKLLGLEERYWQVLYLAGLLHDLGKLAVPDEIIDKPAALDELETAVMHCHSYITYRLISQVDGLEDIACWAGFHHENLDGSGYPFRLAEEKLGLESRVVALADKFTALCEPRPYRPALAPAKVKEILTDMARRGQIDKELLAVAVPQVEEWRDEIISLELNPV